MDQHDRIRTSAILTHADVAHLAGLPARTVRNWSKPGKNRGPVITQGARGYGAEPPTVPLIGLSEAAVAKELGGRGIGPRKVAAIITEAKAADPLAFARRFYTDGTDLFRMLHDELERVKDGQFALRDVFDDFLKRVNFGGDDVMESYTVLGGDDAPTRIVIDPRFSAGRPIIERTATPVFALLDEIEGGDDRRWIAEDFGLELAEVSYVADHREFLAPVA
ncbi:DUF433 domain-containing protein [Brachybacterium sp. EE-P12]|uniref:DUF433 domain-containing protein n=1 Tax=Brachybacterium sp. EE-P12 TaxID=2306299 RepID=UPI000F097464|nr:DUF433 domain-containing protein [Brachybacterium sp. EE-P12]